MNSLKKCLNVRGAIDILEISKLWCIKVHSTNILRAHLWHHSALGTCSRASPYYAYNHHVALTHDIETWAVYII